MTQLLVIARVLPNPKQSPFSQVEIASQKRLAMIRGRVPSSRVRLGKKVSE